MTDLLKITVDSSDVARAQQDIKGLRKSTLDLEKSLKPLIRREKEFKRAVSAVNDAVRLGVANQRQANVALRDLAKQYGYTTKQVQRMNLALVQNTRSFKRFGSVGLQQVGYQVGDFAVQLQGGTNAFVAFGQQGSQLLGIFGPMGAIAGAVLAIFTAFAAPLSQMETGTGAAAEEMAKLKGELEPIATMVKNLGSSLKNVAFDSINAIANNLQKVISYAAAFAAVWIGRLGIVYGIKAATYATATFGSVSAGVFALIKRAIIATGIGALIVALGEAINVMLQLREATGSWGKAFGLVGDVIKAVFAELPQNFSNFLVVIKQTTLRLTALFLEALSGLAGHFKSWIAAIQARFDQLKQWLGRLWEDIAYTIAKSIDDAIDNALMGMQKVFDFLSNLPGEAGTAFRGLSVGVGAAVSAYEPTQEPVKDIETYESLFEKRLQGMEGGSPFLSGTVAGLRKEADALEQLKVETPLTTAAINALEEALASVQQTGTFSMQALMDALAGTGEATELATEQLNEHVEAWKKWQAQINEVLAATELELRQKISLIGLSKEEADLAQFIHDLEKEMGATRSQLNEDQTAQFERILELRREEIALMEEKRAAAERVEAAEKKVQAVSSAMAKETVGALKSIVNGTKTASEAFRDMALNIIQQIMDILIWQPLIQSLTNSISGAISGSATGGGAVGSIVGSIFGFQKGGAFSSGNIVPFANGGIVGSPTMFGMSGGRTGLMGEAGPEAILPLKRGPDGKLGVEGSGSVTVHQTFNFAANGDDSVKKIIAEAAPKIAKMTEAQIINSRQRGGGQMRRAFG
jgi:lambda family phage tail tape measure protein